jgi:hypothetical protein
MEDAKPVVVGGLRWVPALRPGETIPAAISAKSKRPVFKSDMADRLGISDTGVAFVRHGTMVVIPWPELEVSRWYAGSGFLYIATRAGTQDRGGPWKVDRSQYIAVVLDPRWPDRESAERIRRSEETAGATSHSA